jgi:CubicO group peptidase (beta-lactamase class C family)
MSPAPRPGGPGGPGGPGPGDWAATESALRRAVDGLVADGVASGAQVAVRTGDGRRFGLAAGRTHDGGPLTTGVRFPLVSHSKTITTALILGLLLEEGIDLDTPVAHFLPAFGVNGKDRVTLRHLMTHTGGLVEQRSSLEQVGIPFDERFQHVCRMSLYPDWNADADASYSLRASFETLGYLVEFLAGESYGDYFDGTIGRQAGTIGFLTDFRGSPREDAVAAAPWTVFTQMPRPEVEASGVPSSGFGADSLGGLVMSGSPAAGAVGCARDVCTLWSHIGRAAAGEDGLAVKPRVGRAMAHSRRGRRYDRVLGFECDYGYGVMTDLVDYREWGFPPELTERAFGHIGLTHVLAGFSPEWDASFAVILNGRSVKSVEFGGLRSLFSALTTFFVDPAAIHDGQAAWV